MASDSLITYDVEAFIQAFDGATVEIAKLIQKAIRSTMAKTRRKAVTMLSDLIREKWNIKKKDLDKRIRVRIGDRGQDYDAFELTIKGTSVSLAYFGATQYTGNRVQTRTTGRVRKTRSRFQGVQVEVVKGRKTRLAGAFMQAVGSGHIMVARRKGLGRYPLAVKASISPASMFEQEQVQDKFDTELIDYIEKTFAHELDWRLRQAGLA